MGQHRITNSGASLLVGGLLFFSAGKLRAAADGPHSTPQAGTAAFVARELGFIGFARNESLCAWRQTHHTTHGAVVDTASTAIIVHMASHRVLAVYKDGSPRRTNRHGHFVHASPWQLLISQPEYRKAMSQVAWAHLQRRAHFEKLQSQFTNATIRLAPDDDTTMQFTVREQAIHVVAQAPNNLGFGVVARLLDGNLISLGHFRTSSTETNLRAEVRTYFSHSGRSIAVLVHFIGAEVPLAEAYQTALGQTPGSPLADFHIGVRNRTREEGEDLEDLFKDMHPEGAHDWDENVGKLF